MYPSDFIPIPMPPVVAPVTWNAVGMGEGSFTSDVLDGTQGTQHLLGAMPFPADMATTGESIPVSVNCVFHDTLNKTNQTGLTPEEAAANAAQEYWKIDAGEYGLMGSYTFDIESPTDLSTLSQIIPLYKTCGPWQMMNGNCNGPTTNAPENQTSLIGMLTCPWGISKPLVLTIYKSLLGIATLATTVLAGLLLKCVASDGAK